MVDVRKKIRIPGGAGRRRLRLTVRGRVQGVGFRPAVYRFARAAGVGGFVRNTRSGVIIEIEGTAAALESFAGMLADELPPRARIDALEAGSVDPSGETLFAITTSEETGGGEALFPVDTAVCTDCLREMRDRDDPRFRFPFINCTNCGPRFTIIEGLPYDRPLTTMREFEMDRLCRSQYADPGDRRFHAEPICCPGCGPRLRLIDVAGLEIAGDPIAEACELIAAGGVLAVKGLGGYHLACLATDGAVVARLRERKRRPDKPFAVMFRDAAAILRRCDVDETELGLLRSPEAPIVLARGREGALPGAIAPDNGYIGAFLPCTPVHHLLMERFEVLVMTSANFTDEPLVSTEEELGALLGRIADAALVNDRRIAHKCDDSIFFAPAGRPVPLRRARGFVPEPVPLAAPPEGCILGLGGQEKGAFALTRGGEAFVSAHLGDLGDLRSQRNYRAELEAFERLLGVRPEAAARDMHPDYFTSRLAGELGLPVVEVQHHHAHAASVMAEYGLCDPVIAVCFDGTGYGEDGALWGGEFLLAGLHEYRRLAHLKYVPLPGGETAVREPWRMALMHLRNLYGERVLDLPLPSSLPLAELPAGAVLTLAERGINSYPTSSMGRLFDAVASLLGCGVRVSYEAQAAAALENLALSSAGTTRAYRFETGAGSPALIDPAPVIERIVRDLARGAARGEIAAAFHNGVAELVVETAQRLAASCGCRTAVVSGGVFQNRFLCERVLALAARSGLELLMHRIVPPNDGGVSLGQVQAAAAMLRRGITHGSETRG